MDFRTEMQLVGKLFGTDGIRGVANEDLNIDLALRVGQAAAMVLARGKGKKPVIAIGKDTRLSGDMLESALVAGMCSAGADVMVLGIVPTPAVAFITKLAGADAGIVISASHNPYMDNGIKIFNGNGFKLSDELECEIEELVLSGEKLQHMTSEKIGRVLRKNKEYADKYIDHLEQAAEGDIKNLRVLVDCSNGAASRTASELFTRFDIDVEIMKVHPNGLNINEGCGSTHLEFIQEIMRSGSYDIGIAFDGDADRCLIIDENGRIIDGDRILAVCAMHMKKDGILKHDTVVATVMSNLGFHIFAKKHGINLICTSVGDRNVLEKMLEGGYNLGGEQSGHLIFLDEATTGDGQLAAVKFLSIVRQTGKKVSELVSDIPYYPQVLINTPVSGGNPAKDAIMESEELTLAIKRAEEELGSEGRILIRPSGTEPLIRVMVEASDDKIANCVAENLTNLIKNI